MTRLVRSIIITLLLSVLCLPLPGLAPAQFSSPFGGGGGTSSPIATTYDELFGVAGKATLGQLVPGQRYSFEFHSRFASPGAWPFNVITGDPETIIVTAISTTAVDTVAQSVTYPDDDIKYTPSNDAFAGGNGDRGHILWREYTPRKVAGDFDWRALRVTVSEEVQGSGLFNLKDDSGYNAKTVPVFYAMPDITETAYFDPPTNAQPMEWAEITILSHANGGDGIRAWPHVSFERSVYKVYLSDGNDSWRACGDAIEVFQGTCYASTFEGGIERFYSAHGCGITRSRAGLSRVSVFGAVGTVNGYLTNAQFQSSIQNDLTINGNHSGVVIDGGGITGPGALGANLVDDPGFNIAAAWSGITVIDSMCSLNNASEVVTETAPLTAVVGQQYVIGVKMDSWTSGSFDLSVGGASITVAAGGLSQGIVTAATTAGLTITNTDMIGDIGSVWCKPVED